MKAASREEHTVRFNLASACEARSAAMLFKRGQPPRGKERRMADRRDVPRYTAAHVFILRPVWLQLQFSLPAASHRGRTSTSRCFRFPGFGSADRNGRSESSTDESAFRCTCPTRFEGTGRCNLRQMHMHSRSARPSNWCSHPAFAFRGRSGTEPRRSAGEQGLFRGRVLIC
jgi:hypothetical protein